MSPEIASRDTFSIHVYESAQRSGQPRCHVRRRNDGTDTVVGLPFLEVLVGPSLSDSEKQALLEHLQELIDAFK